MPEIKIIISTALEEKKKKATSPVSIIAINHLNDELQMMPQGCSKERFVRVIDLKRKSEEQAFYSFVEAEEDTLTEISVEKDTLLNEIEELLRNL